MDDLGHVALTPEFVQRLAGCQSSLYAYIVTSLGNAVHAQDVLQETNLKLCRKAGEYDPAQPFLRWAYVFSLFEVLAWQKRQQRERLVLDEDLLNQIAVEMEQDATSAERELAALESCLQRLPEQHRKLVDARYREGDAVQDIAARLGRPENAVAATLYRIRQTLMDCIHQPLGEARAGQVCQPRQERRRLIGCRRTHGVATEYPLVEILPQTNRRMVQSHRQRWRRQHQRVRV